MKATISSESDVSERVPERVPVRIVTMRRTHDWHACIEGHQGIWGCGPTPEAAIGSMVMSHPDRFGATLGAALAIATPEIQPTQHQRFVARTHLSLLRGIANGAGHNRHVTAGVAPCLDAGLIEEDDEVGLVQLTNLGRRALALETVAQGSPAP